MAQKLHTETEDTIDDVVESIELENDTDSAVREIDEEPAEGLIPLAVDPDDEKRIEKKRSAHPLRRRLLIALVMAAVLTGVFAAVPFLRYGFMGLFVRKEVTLRVVDDVNRKAVSGVTVSLGRDVATTDKDGVARFADVRVGDYYVQIEKKYYAAWSGSILVPIFADVSQGSIAIKATGRTVTVNVKQRLTGKPVSDAKVAIGDTSAMSDARGVAILVVATDSKVAEGTVKADNYTDASFAMKTGLSEDQSIDVGVVPVGRVAYLSKATGSINVMSANLDGTDPTVVLAGTGKEYDRDTVMAATSDWQYVALLANREGKTQLYLVNATDGGITKIDDEEGIYSFVGWSDDHFIYMVNRNRSTWQPGQVAIKSYDMVARKLRVIDESQATGTGWYDYQAQTVSAPQLMAGRAIYTKSWFGSSGTMLGKKNELISAQGNGVKASLKSLDATAQSFGVLQRYRPNAAYVGVHNAATGAYEGAYEVKNGALATASLTEDALTNLAAPAYVISPTGKKTAWSESRDGKDVVLVGDESGLRAVQLSPVGYKVYGWFTDAYLLLSKNNSELYVYPADGGIAEPVKITNYHKPVLDQRGGWYGLGV